jgi:transposase
MALILTRADRTELERRATSRTIRAEDAKRAKVILMLADGTSYSTIEATLWCFRDYINRWRRRFVAHGLEGLRSRHQGQKPTVLTAALEARILAKTQQPPPDGSTQWSTRKLARVLAIHHNHVQTAWSRAGVQPHRFARYMRSDDPDFEPKAADVIGLYLQPPQHAAVFAADEKTGVCRALSSRTESPRTRQPADHGKARGRRRRPRASALAPGRTAELLRACYVISALAEMWNSTPTTLHPGRSPNRATRDRDRP